MIGLHVLSAIAFVVVLVLLIISTRVAWEDRNLNAATHTVLARQLSLTLLGLIMLALLPQVVATICK